MLDVKVDATRVQAKFDAMPVKLHDAVKAKITYFTILIEQKTKDNLLNKVLRYITGELYSSIFSTVEDKGSEITGTVASSASSKAAPYAAIQEYGGVTKPHVIEARNAKALLIPTSGKSAVYASFYRKVNHPGSHIPAHRYLGGPFDEVKGDIPEALRQAATGAMQL